MRLFLTVLLLLSVISCNMLESPPQVKEENVLPVQNLVLNEKISTQSNYKLGEVRNVFVGDQVVKKKTEKIKTQSRLVAIPLMNIVLISDRIN